MNLIGEAHSPMHNINRFSKTHKNGDDYGKLHKIGGTHSNLMELWDNSFGMFGDLSYPITSDKEVEEYAAEIMKEFPRASLETDLKDVSKKSWSDHSYAIAKDTAYTLAEGATPTDEYIKEGKAILRKQIALAAYRVADQIVYCMGV